MHPAQAGFRKGFSTLTQILIRADTLRFDDAKVSVFYDFKDAYNRVNLQRLFQRLQELNCPPRTLSLIYGLMVHNTQNIIIVNQSKSEPIHRTRGLFQGSVISCLLFNVYIDPLLRKLNERFPTKSGMPSALLFADDLHTCAPNGSVAQQQANVTDQWSQEFGMELNIGKCSALGLEEDESISLPSGEFPKPETYKYLGLDQDKNGHAWDSYCDRIQASTRALLRFCQGVGTSWPTKSKIAIYKAFIRPKSDYCAPILWHHARSTPGGMKLIGMFTDLHKDALQWIFSTGQKLRCKVLLESLSAIAPPRRRYDELAANFSSHIIRSAEENPIHLALRLHGDWYQSHSLLPLC